MKKYVFAAVFAATLALPTSTEAFELIDTAAYDLGFAQLFTMEFELGYLNAETVMPVLAVTPYVDYEFTNEDEVLQSGQSGAIILSGAVAENGAYRVPVGERETFTVLAIYQGDVAADSFNLVAFSHQIIKSDGDVFKMSPSDEQLASYQATIE